MKLANFLLCMAIIIFVVIVSLIPVLIGFAQKHRTVKPVELFPPRGASPIDVLIGYYGRLADPRKFFNPLMLYWAERGFITIEEDCKRGLKLTKLKDIKRPESDDGFNLKTYSLEERLFGQLFGNNGEVFYTLSASAEFAKFYKEIMKSCKTQAERTSNKKTAYYAPLSTALSVLLIFAVSVFIGFTVEIDGSYANVGLAVLMLFPVIALLVLRFSPDSKGMEKASMKYFLYPFFAFWGGAPLIIALVLMPIEASVLLALAFAAAAFIMFFLPKKIDYRTAEQLKDYGQICGFKNFLLLAESKKLEALVEENPEYFYEILPYCYILGITEKLKPKFDRIIMDGPGWYLGELRDTLMF